jgi:hypothetical protein
MLVSILVLVLAVLIIAGSCATKNQAYIPKSDEELYGAWVNTDYTGVDYAQKFILYNWGYCEIFRLVSDQNIDDRAVFYIMDKWTDPEGNIWYKVTWQFKGATKIIFELTKINENEGSWERVWSYKDFLSESDLTPEHVLYGIRYRQE